MVISEWKNFYRIKRYLRKTLKKLAKNQFFVIFEGENLSKIKKSWVISKGIFEAFLMPFSEC